MSENLKEAAKQKADIEEKVLGCAVERSFSNFKSKCKYAVTEYQCYKYGSDVACCEQNCNEFRDYLSKCKNKVQVNKVEIRKKVDR